MRDIIQEVIWFAPAWEGRENYQEWEDWYDVPFASDDVIQDGMRGGCPFKWVIDYIRKVDPNFEH